MPSVVGLSSAALLWCTVLGQAARAGQGPDYRLFHDRGKDDAAAPAEGAKVNRLAPIAGDWSFTGGSELKRRLSPNPLQERRSAALMALNVGAGLKAWQQFPTRDFRPENMLVLISHFANSLRIMPSRIPYLTAWANGVARNGYCSG